MSLFNINFKLVKVHAVPLLDIFTRMEYYDAQCIMYDDLY